MLGNEITGNSRSYYELVEKLCRERWRKGFCCRWLQLNTYGDADDTVSDIILTELPSSPETIVGFKEDSGVLGTL